MCHHLTPQDQGLHAVAPAEGLPLQLAGRWLTSLHAGKTLIARQIGKRLNGREPKVVNGPEVLNKYVGASEENIRKLFADAEAEQAARGDASELHVIIFDEIDAICKSRGSVQCAPAHACLVVQTAGLMVDVE